MQTKAIEKKFISLLDTNSSFLKEVGMTINHTIVMNFWTNTKTSLVEICSEMISNWYNQAIFVKMMTH